jgi:hypothetical protein
MCIHGFIHTYTHTPIHASARGVVDTFESEKIMRSDLKARVLPIPKPPSFRDASERPYSLPPVGVRQAEVCASCIRMCM